MILRANGPFDFGVMYDFMERQDDCLYQTRGGKVRRAEIFGGRRVLFEVSESAEPDGLEVEILHDEGAGECVVSEYVADWFDLDYDLERFYAFARRDGRFEAVTGEYYGFRMLAYVNVTDVLVWSIIGQQINMKFAFELKRRLVEYFGHFIEYEGEKYWIMPSAGELLTLTVEDMREMQISRRKAEYILNCAEGVENGSLSKEYLQSFDSYSGAKTHLTGVRGIGPWSANVVLMRTVKFRHAVPVGDAGLRNALKITDGLDGKPGAEYIEDIISWWGQFGAYATLYMWRVLG
ncbi:DNA-3-methyladenine glycosylase family protein [Salinicoccus carnicancri]|uniref:DNA-3-methyladenine glycosylase family protein n=1 Tax=Salinicoccus carnicancri TaxID=558170 RepID=UPI0002F4F36E|nr:DNA glycosylase [Salinicoccus carnicancri]